MKKKNGKVEVIFRNGSNLTCKCECGKIFKTTLERFYKAKSCGCLKRESLRKRSKINPGDRFGFLLVESPAYKDESGNYKWNCACFCGNKKSVRSHNLLSGKSKSCGCISSALRNESFYANNPELAQRVIKKTK